MISKDMFSTLFNWPRFELTMVASASMEQSIDKHSNRTENRNAYKTASVIIPKCLKREGKTWLITFVHPTTVLQIRRSLWWIVRIKE